MVSSGPEPRNLAIRVWRSIFSRPLRPASDHDRRWIVRHHFLLHLRPVLVDPRSLRWRLTMGLGGSSLVLITLLAATGILMMLVYQPAPGDAWRSVAEIEGQVAFGSLVRGIHYWSAQLLVVVMLLHAARVVLTGGHLGPRQFNWVIGCVLALVVLSAAFTGYLLPWDQLAYWAITIATGMLRYVPVVGETLTTMLRGGPEVNGTTLIVFYTLHTTIVPVLLLLLLGFHFWRVRRAGGVVVPDDEPTADKALVLPHLLLPELAQGLAVAAVIVVLAAAFGAPLGEPANPGMSPNPAKAPWYFMGVQEMLIHLHPSVALLVLPLLAAAGLLALPYLSPSGATLGRWFGTGSGRRSAAIAAGVATTLTPVAVIFGELGGGSPGWFGGGLLPLIAVAGCAAAIYLVTTRRLGATPHEGVQAVLVMIATAFLTLTLIGIFCRGAGMALIWPWSG